MSSFDRGSSSELDSTGGGFLMRTACCGFDGSFLGLPRRLGAGALGAASGAASGVGSGVGGGASGVASSAPGSSAGTGSSNACGSSSAGGSTGSKETSLY